MEAIRAVALGSIRCKRSCNASFFAEMRTMPRGSDMMDRGNRPTRGRCGARTRKGTACIRKALRNGRCPNHGGLSTGPKTAEGKARISAAQRQRWERLRFEAGSSCDADRAAHPIRACVMGSSPSNGVYATRPPGCAPETISSAIRAGARHGVLEQCP